MLFNMSSSVLNDEVDEAGLPVALRNFNCGGCGSKVVYAIRYLLCDRCLTYGNPSYYVTKTKKDRVGG